MSVTMTCSLRYAAVPQDPTIGPILIPSTSDMKSFGKRGAAPTLKQLFESTSCTEAIESVEILSTKQHSSCITVASGLPVATICRILFSPASSASAFFRSSMSVLVPNHLIVLPLSTRCSIVSLLVSIKLVSTILIAFFARSHLWDTLQKDCSQPILPLGKIRTVRSIAETCKKRQNGFMQAKVVLVTGDIATLNGGKAAL